MFICFVRTVSSVASRAHTSLACYDDGIVKCNIHKMFYVKTAVAIFVEVFIHLSCFLMVAKPIMYYAGIYKGLFYIFLLTSENCESLKI